MTEKMDESSTPQMQQRAESTATRIAHIGIPKQELAQRAGIDRGTLGRLLKADPRISDRTWVKVERVLSNLEEELGIGVQMTASTASGETADVVTSTVEYAGARITLSGRADAVAEAIRKVLDEAGN